MRSYGKDIKGHTMYRAVCTKCGNTDIPEQILGGGSAGGGKALGINELVLTPTGFKKTKDLQVGNVIIDPTTGGTQQIIWLHPMGKFPFYRIKFIDGTSIECSEGHLWRAHLWNSKTIERIWTTKEIYNLYQKNRNEPLAIPLTEPIKFAVDEPILPIAPYSLGRMIGNSLIFYLKMLKGIDSNPCIPHNYKYSSINQRIKLIQGLMDSNGEVDNDGRLFYKAWNKQLAEDVAFVVRSLGGIATIIHYSFNSYYTVHFETKMDSELVTLERKKALVHHDVNNELDKRIVSVEYIGKQKSRCISVSSPSGLYCANDFTVTHNSFLGCCWLVYSCMQFPGIRMIVARKVRKTLLETTWLTLKDVLSKWGLKENENYHINNQTYVITFWNGSTITAMDLTPMPSDPDFNSLGSLEITGAFVDEVSEVSEKAIEVLASRIRYKIEDTFIVGKIFMSTNPCLNWVKSTFVMDDNGDPVTLPKGYRYIPFSLFDNPNEKFRAIYYNRLSKIRDKATRNRLLYGNWVFTEANKMAAYWNFDGDKHLKQNLLESKYNPLNPLILSFDFNVNPYMTCLPMQFDYEEKQVYIFPEFIGKPQDKLNNTPAFTRYIAGILNDWGHLGGVMITGDPAGLARSTQTEEGTNNFTIAIKNLRQFSPKLQLLTKQPAQVTRLEFVNELFKNFDGWTVNIDVKCHRLIDDFAYQKKNPDGTKEKKKVLLDSGEKAERYGHASDCFDYAMVYYLNKAYEHYRSNESTIVTTISPDEMVYDDFSF